MASTGISPLDQSRLRSSASGRTPPALRQPDLNVDFLYKEFGESR